MVVSPRVAILTPFRFSEYPGGVEVFNEQLAACLPSVEVFALPPGRSRRVGRLDSVGLAQPLQAWSVYRRFEREHRRHPFQLAISNGLYGWPLTALPPGIPLIQVYHFTVAGLARRGIAERGVRAHMQTVEARFDRLSGSGKEVVAVGRNVLEEVRAFYHHDGRVIPNGVDLRVFAKRDRAACRRELRLPPAAHVGLFVGRPQHVKGFDILQKVVQAAPETRFLVVGGGEGLGPNAIVYPQVPREQMPLFYSAADFLILPSRYEGFSLTILEALACDLPILVSRAAYALEEDWPPLGAVIDSQEPQAYLEALRALPVASEEPSGREEVASRYSIERFRETWRARAFESMGLESAARVAP